LNADSHIPIARHNEIGNRMAEVIYKEAAAKPQGIPR